MSNEVIFFGLFIIFILFILFADLLLIGRNSHELKFREALIWSGVWISLGLIFFGFLWNYGYLIHGLDTAEAIKQKVEFNKHPISLTGDYTTDLSLYNHNLALEYLTGYVLEYSLSIDNIFVIILIFSSFGIKKEHYKKVLFWGILGAIVMRFIFIFVAGELIHNFEWVLYIFGAILILSGGKMLFSGSKKEEIDTQKHPVVRIVSKLFRVSKSEDDRFFIKVDKRNYITPLFIVLLIVEFSDLVFAVDSIPAIFSVTRDTYIVFFSNVFAIIGLRSLFFLVIRVVKLFRFLGYAISILLIFIGLKISLHSFTEEWGFTTVHSLIIVFAIISSGILLSVLIPDKDKAADIND